MKFFNENPALKTISTMCAAGALLASQAVFAGSDVHSADKDAKQAATYTSQEEVNAQANESSTANDMSTASTGSQNANDSEGYDATGEDSIDTDRSDDTVGTTRMWESEDNLFEQADANDDNRLDRDEMNAASEQQQANTAGSSQSQSFDDYDMNDDEYIDADEYDSYSADLQANEENRAASIEADE